MSFNQRAADLAQRYHREGRNPVNATTANAQGQLPWRCFGGMVDGYGIVDANGNLMVPQQSLVNREMRLIVQAVNNHEKLVTALRDVLMRRPASHDRARAVLAEAQDGD